MPIISIILCTRDNTESLRKTLAALTGCRVPADLPAELILVDNASKDSTPSVAAAAHIPGIKIRYVREPRPGKGYAYNTGIAAATGDVLLFTDDDTRPPMDWIGGMCHRIADNQVDAVAGGVRIAPHLLRSWMTGEIRSWFASTDRCADEPAWRMVGANMAFSRRILQKVPGFDTELGPGGLGFEDETMLSRQIVACGYRVERCLDVVVEHWFRPQRLTRRSIRDIAAKMGRSHSYVEHHWIHYHRSMPLLRWAKHWIQLQSRLLLSGRQSPEQVQPWEVDLARQVGLYAQAIREQRRPRRYARLGMQIRPEVLLQAAAPQSNRVPDHVRPQAVES